MKFVASNDLDFLLSNCLKQISSKEDMLQIKD